MSDTLRLADENKKSKTEQLYEQYYKLMLYVAMELLQSQAAAEDAVHESFIKIIKNLDKIDLTKPKETKRYIVVITERTCLDILRKRKQQSELSLEELEERNLSEQGNDEIVKFHETEILRQILETMPELTRQIFLMKYGSGYDNAEIAEILHITEMTVRQRISREKRKLKKYLRKEGTML